MTHGSEGRLGSQVKQREHRDHPHRGFETVTYMLEGKFEHKDSRGNSGKLGPGDVSMDDSRSWPCSF